MRTARSAADGTVRALDRHALLHEIKNLVPETSGLRDPSTRWVGWTPLLTLTALTLMAWDDAPTLVDRFAGAAGCLRRVVGARRFLGSSYTGLAKAMQRQGATVLPAVKRELRAAAVGLAEPDESGWILVAGDGSKIECPRTVSNEKVFGIADNGAQPQALLTTLVEARCGVPLGWRVAEGRACEQHELAAMLAELPERCLLLLDAYYVGHPLWRQIQEAGRHFIVRAGSHVHLIRALFPDTEIERRGGVVYAWPQARRGEAPIRLRLVAVHTRGSVMHLLTDVLDRAVLPDRAIARLYRARWGVEVFYRSLKRTLQRSRLRSASGARARLELEWTLVATVFLAVLGARAIRDAGSDPARLSVARALRALRRLLAAGAGAGADDLAERLGTALRDSYHRKRPKASRHNPRTVNTPPRRLGSPIVRRATAKERRIARERFPQLLAA